ncbi:hypothetical protein, partial [Clostridium perfringens]
RISASAIHDIDDLIGEIARIGTRSETDILNLAATNPMAHQTRSALEQLTASLEHIRCSQASGNPVRDHAALQIRRAMSLT